MAFSEQVPGLSGTATHAGFSIPGGGCPGHQRPVPEVPSEARCAHELPVHHAKGGGKGGAAGSCTLLVQRVA